MPKNTAATQRQLACPECAGDAFSIRLLKDDGVGVAKCTGCARDYLLFDSADHWYDVIQERYPPERRCACKGSAFRLRADYELRDDGDIRHIQLRSTCTQCLREKRELSIDIDYGDTASLMAQPLVFCAQPRLLYALKDLSMFATPARIAALVEYLHAQEGCTFFGMVREDRQWVHRPLAGPEAVAVVLADVASDGLDSFHWLLALPSYAQVPVEEVDSARGEAAFWKREEAIHLSGPSHIAGSKLYYVKFADERVDGFEVRPKSAAFRATTARLLRWLAQEFVSWRGPTSFDDAVVHEQKFGDRFTRRK